MNATELDLNLDINRFAQQVRVELADLPGDDADDLLDGLEADLAEQALDRGEDFALPDPATYAAELRAAAGLPPRAAGSRRTSARDVMAAISVRLHQVESRVRDNHAAAWLLDLCAALRPVWWILRGWAWFAVVALVLGASPFPDALSFLPIALLAGLILVSVQWGRGRWLPRAWLRVARTVLSVLAVVVLPFLIVYGAQEWSSRGAEEYVDPSVYYPQGMAVDGERVRNIYAYDAEGNALTDVQLFDQDGRPLVTTGSEGKANAWDVDHYFYAGGGPVPVPLRIPSREAIWNVYPLQELPAGAGTDGLDPDLDRAQTRPFPYAQVPALPAADPTRDDTDATQTPTATPAPSGTPSATPSPEEAPLESPTP